MLRTPLSAFLLLLICAGGAEGQDTTPFVRLDAALRLVARPGLGAGLLAAPPAGATGAAAGELPMASLAAPETAADGATYLRVLARIGDGGEAALERLGARIGVRAGDVVTAWIPADAIPRAAAAAPVRYLEAARLLQPHDSRGSRASLSPARRHSPFDLDLALPGGENAAEVGAQHLRQLVGGRFVGLAGQGVVIGVVDSGLDLQHEDFRDADGRTRVLYAWDQNAVGGRAPGTVGGARLDYGHECNAAEIDAGACAHGDRNGHGTHVAGIAAGDGSATGNDAAGFRFTGVAPAADLIIVKAGDGGFSADRVLEGVAYIFARAAELGRPAVVNLSLGTQSGPHDGTLLIERGLNALTGPGRIIVASAGNQGSNGNERPVFPRSAQHATGIITTGGTIEHGLVVPAYPPRSGSANDGVVLELWYDGRDSLTVSIATPSGQTLVAATGDTALLRTPEGSILIDNASGGIGEANGDRAVLAVIVDEDSTAVPGAGRWTVAVHGRSVAGSGSYHLWLVGSTLTAVTQLTSLDGGTTNTHLVSAPATADRVIAVGAYAARSGWRGPEGDASFPFQEPAGDIAFFSSPGPRRDGRLKPELTAPGKVVISAKSRDAELWNPLPWMVEQDGVHAANLGTSMASPQVAGAIALLLQLRPGLTAEEALALLADAARQDTFTRRTYAGGAEASPNPHWGYGKLNVAAAVHRLGSTDGRLVLPGERINFSANPVRGTELIVNYAAPPASIEIYSITGALVRRLNRSDLEGGRAVWRLDNAGGASVADGVYLFVAHFPEGRVTQKILVARR